MGEILETNCEECLTKSNKNITYSKFYILNFKIEHWENLTQRDAGFSRNKFGTGSRSEFPEASSGQAGAGYMTVEKKI